MDSISVNVAPREVTGKAVKHLRRQGFVPAVIHNHGKDSIVVQVEYQAAIKAYLAAGRHRTLDVTADGHKYTTLIKSVTFDPKYNSMTHIVFNAVKANQKVEATVPVRARFAEGSESSPAEKSGLIVLNQLEEVEVEALPKNLPDALTYDAEKLVNVGDHVTVADLTVPEGVTVANEPNQTLATVFEPSALAAANEEAGGDAEAGDEANVAAEHEGENQPEAGADEMRPGGKKENEDKSQGHNPEKQ